MQMIEAFRAADYYSLKDRYAWAATDCPTYTTSISIDGKSKEISDYVGEKVGMPESVTKVEEAIDSFSGVERWTKGNSETVSALEQEKFDFKSTEASEILVNVAKRGNADAVRDLVASGVPVAKPTPDRFSSTALENAAKRGDTDMIQALLSAGINDTEMKTRALAEAASAGKVDGMLLLIEYGANPIAPEVLIGAARSGVPEIVQQILQYKPNVNGRGPNQQPPLLAAISAYHNEDAAIDVEGVVRILLDADCDPNLADKKGMTPLIANARDAEIAEMLIAHGANVNAQANDGFTPLMNAGTAELTRLLLEHGANPFAKSKRGETALDWAKQTGKNKQAAILEAAMTGKHQ
jgi:ankyrin repeat protein